MQVIEAMEHYVKTGEMFGGFLSRITVNDLRGAFLLASDPNQLMECVQWFEDNAPAECWGSEERRRAWKGTDNV